MSIDPRIIRALANRARTRRRWPKGTPQGGRFRDEHRLAEEYDPLSSLSAAAEKKLRKHVADGNRESFDKQLKSAGLKQFSDTLWNRLKIDPSTGSTPEPPKPVKKPAKKKAPAKKATKKAPAKKKAEPTKPPEPTPPPKSVVRRRGRGRVAPVELPKPTPDPVNDNDADGSLQADRYGQFEGQRVRRHPKARAGSREELAREINDAQDTFLRSRPERDLYANGFRTRMEHIDLNGKHVPEPPYVKEARERIEAFLPDGAVVDFDYWPEDHLQMAYAVRALPKDDALDTLRQSGVIKTRDPVKRAKIMHNMEILLSWVQDGRLADVDMDADDFLAAIRKNAEDFYTGIADGTEEMDREFPGALKHWFGFAARLPSAEEGHGFDPTKFMRAQKAPGGYANSIADIDEVIDYDKDDVLHDEGYGIFNAYSLTYIMNVENRPSGTSLGGLATNPYMRGKMLAHHEIGHGLGFIALANWGDGTLRMLGKGVAGHPVFDPHQSTSTRNPDDHHLMSRTFSEPTDITEHRVNGQLWPMLWMAKRISPYAGTNYHESLAERITLYMNQDAINQYAHIMRINGVIHPDTHQIQHHTLDARELDDLYELGYMPGIITSGRLKMVETIDGVNRWVNTVLKPWQHQRWEGN